MKRSPAPCCQSLHNSPMPLSSGAIVEAANVLAEARMKSIAMAEIPVEWRPETLDDAYAIQSGVHERLRNEGWGPVVGHKVGCTTEVMQKYHKIDRPCAGGIFETTVHAVEGRYDRSAMHRPGVECEIAVRLCADLPGRNGPYDQDSVVPAVGSVMTSIELVDDRWTDFTQQPMACLLADEVFGAGCVLGSDVGDWQNLDLAALSGRMRVNGVEVGSGTGADMLGDPLNALVWLADLRVKQGRPLKEGEFVTLGSLVQTVWMDSGDEVLADIDGLGIAVLNL